MDGRLAGQAGGVETPSAENMRLLKPNAARRLLEPHEELLEAGYNVVPVDAQKRPLAPRYAECYEKRCLELGRLFESKSVKKKQTGIALLGRVNPYLSEKILVIVDIDDPRKFPDETRRLLGGTWHWYTGPRCPRDGDKHNIKCEGGICRHSDHEFKVSEAIRGEAYAILIPAEAEKLVGKGVAKTPDGAVELRVRGYQLMPPSIHPSGVVYEWVTPPWRDGEFKHPKELSLEEFKRLVETLGLHEERPQGAQQAAERSQGQPKPPSRWRHLSGGKMRAIVELLKPAYKPEHRQNIALYVSGWMAKEGISPETAATVVYWLHQETGDEDPLEQRISAVVCTYQLAGYPEVDKRLGDALKIRISGCSGQRDKQIKGKSGLMKELTAVLGEEKAWQIMTKLSEIIDDKIRLTLKRDCLKEILVEGVDEPFCKKAVWVEYQGELALIKLVTVSKSKNDNLITDYTKVALLPKYMGIAYDPYYGEKYYVAYYKGRLLTFAPISNFDAFLQDIRQRPPFYVASKSPVLDLLKKYMKTKRVVVSAGLVRSGVFVDPHRTLDTTDCGPEPLKAAYRWVRQAYGERNAKLAWLNVMAAFAKIITPVVRHMRGKDTFNDQIVYNYGRGGEGKSTLARYVLTPMLGEQRAIDAYFIRLDGSIKTDAQLRNLLDLNRLPLILDEQTRQALERNLPVVLSAAVGEGITGIHAARYGHGIGAKFKNLRGIILFTNVKFQDFLDNVAKEASDYAVMRRFLVLTWNFEDVRPEAHSQHPDIKPVYGYAARLWRKYRGELLQAHDLLSLIEKLADVMMKEHPDDPEVKEMAEYTRQVVAEIREEKRVEKASLRDDATLLRRAYRFVAEELKVSQLSALKVLRYTLENAHSAKIAFSRPRSGDREELVDRLRSTIEKIEQEHTVAYDPQTGRRLTEDAAVVASILHKLIEEGKLQVVLFAKGKLVEGYPAEFLGMQKSVYVNPYTGQKEHGYAVPLYRFVEIFISAAEAEEART
jgi:hypothetical protein